jgi:MarR family transcriptional regulator, transcriptional regulator for hemolysin
VADHDLRSNVGHWAHVAAHRFERAMNDELAAEGLTYRQCQVLGWIAIDGELAQVDLAERMNIEPPTLVRVLDGMERAGLIERIACPGDRRRKVVRATAKSLPIWQKIIACANRVRSRSIRGLSEAEEASLRRLLRKVHDNLESHRTAPEPGRLVDDQDSPAGAWPADNAAPRKQQRSTGVVNR